MKVLHLPTSVGGNSWQLAQSERQLGLHSDVLYQTQNWLGYPADIILDKTGRFPNIFMKSIIAALTIPQKYNVLHFNFGSTLIDIPERGIQHWDLSLYKKQRLFVTYNGCDARQKYNQRHETPIYICNGASCTSPLCKTEKLDNIKAKRIQQFADAGTKFFALNPDLMYFLPEDTTFLPYTITGWDEIQPAPILSQKGTPLKIVHAPTNQAAKGTAGVLKAAEILAEQYPGKFELQLVEGVSHKDAIKLYREADLIIDQLRAGWFGAFAIECMKMGKPVIAYINQEDLHFIPVQMAKDVCEAFINANEYDLADVLKPFIEDPSLLLHRSSTALAFVHRWYDPIKTAAITKTAYNS